MVRVFAMGASWCGRSGVGDAGVRNGLHPIQLRAQFSDVAAGHRRPRQTGDREKQEAWQKPHAQDAVNAASLLTSGVSSRAFVSSRG